MVRNNGIMSGISQGSRHDHTKSDGKRRPSGSSTSSKLTVKDTKYTIVRSKEDIAELDKVRKIFFENGVNISLKTDSEIYRRLPTEFQVAVKRAIDLDHQVEVLTAELDQLAELRGCFCRILELCKEKRKP